MTKHKLYNELKDINKLAWRDDDLMRQETLFELQEKLAEILLSVARDCGETAQNDLVKSFPWLYSFK